MASKGSLTGAIASCRRARDRGPPSTANGRQVDQRSGCFGYGVLPVMSECSAPCRGGDGANVHCVAAIGLTWPLSWRSFRPSSLSSSWQVFSWFPFSAPYPWPRCSPSAVDGWWRRAARSPLVVRSTERDRRSRPCVSNHGSFIHQNRVRLQQGQCAWRQAITLRGRLRAVWPGHPESRPFRNLLAFRRVHAYGATHCVCLGHCEPWPDAVDHKFSAAVFRNRRRCDPLHRPSLTPCNSVSARGFPKPRILINVPRS